MKALKVSLVLFGFLLCGTAFGQVKPQPKVTKNPRSYTRGTAVKAPADGDKKPAQKAIHVEAVPNKQQ